jgi:hypothetical protein
LFIFKLGYLCNILVDLPSLGEGHPLVESVPEKRRRKAIKLIVGVAVHIFNEIPTFEIH